MYHSLPQKEAMAIFAVVVIGTTGFFMWLSDTWYRDIQNIPRAIALNTQVFANRSARGIGSDIATRARNPVQGRLPEGAGTMPNALEGAYKNPFE